jgi:hypothetical protein
MRYRTLFEYADDVTPINLFIFIMKVINTKWVLIVIILILLLIGFIFQLNFRWTSQPSSLSLFSFDEQQLRSSLKAVSEIKNKDSLTAMMRKK